MGPLLFHGGFTSLVLALNLHLSQAFFPYHGSGCFLAPSRIRLRLAYRILMPCGPACVVSHEALVAHLIPPRHQTMERPSRCSSEGEWQSEKDNLLPESEYIPPSSHRRSTRSIALIILSIITTNLLSTLLTYTLTKSSTISSYSQDLPSSKSILPLFSFNPHLTDLPYSPKLLPKPGPHPPQNPLQQPHPQPHIHLFRPTFNPSRQSLERPRNPRRHVLAPENALGEGIGASYGVFVQGLHDMHCLVGQVKRKVSLLLGVDADGAMHCAQNEIRRALYFNKDYYRQFEDDSLTPEWIVVSPAGASFMAKTDVFFFFFSFPGHCLDNMRERIMCSADTGVIPTVWVSEEENYPLFGWQEHKCHDYKALMDWFRNWHASDLAKKVDWTGKLKAPDETGDVIARLT
ncbi:uncharacterized protein MYCFIDRAFT_170987 [Pseudocercospora fijiensis CIRAD86]|uniref:Uncharacterized protein n=1 Tax=Pseudocercospora fijiensis (strain CIRAD86) TaxID=383855 RepID=N1Q9H1_PSEFD|nr:uncharacterized protein MYCFIDRAFT_170987 [Pseudocercospora fijiensis CIRAD86]EME89545.1 hypothetical protein MYCFIDRAFT_170987 [Pseudocercospora fijiensis CIRAD86]